MIGFVFGLLEFFVIEFDFDWYLFMCGDGIYFKMYDVVMWMVGCFFVWIDDEIIDYDCEYVVV